MSLVIKVILTKHKEISVVNPVKEYFTVEGKVYKKTFLGLITVRTYQFSLNREKQDKIQIEPYISDPIKLIRNDMVALETLLNNSLDAAMDLIIVKEETKVYESEILKVKTTTL